MQIKKILLDIFIFFMSTRYGYPQWEGGGGLFLRWGVLTPLWTMKIWVGQYWALPDSYRHWLLSTHVKNDALSSKLKYQSDALYDLFLFITSMWTYSVYNLFLKDVICFIAIESHFLGKKCSGWGL